MRAARLVLLAVLVVSASVVGSVGLVGSSAAQTSSYSQTFTTGPHKVAIDLSNVTTQTTISVITDESPAGNNTAILRKTVSGTTTSAHFRNAGAYNQFTVKVKSADAKPGFSKGGVTDAWTPGDSGKFLGDTGGDPGFTYDLSEQIGESVMPQVVQLDRTGLPGTTTVNTTGTDAKQTKLDLYQSVQNTQASSENYRTTLDNYLQDTKTVARIKGKNAYIRSLNNGSSKSAAKYAAKQAVADYYATKQVQLINQWNIQMRQVQYMRSVAANESGLSAGDVVSPVMDTTKSFSPKVRDQEYGTVKSVTLVNSSTTTALKFRIKGENYNGGTGTYYGANWSPYIGPTNTAGSIHWDSGGDIHLERVEQPDPTSADDIYSAQTLLPWWEFGQRWSDIQTQTDTVQAEMDTLANNTYSAYQNGEINNSDLMDPYVLSSQQSAGDDFQGWVAAQLTLMGQNSPENFDQIGSFNVTTGNGTQYEGVLFSAENPASGQFENGTTYDAANISGTQYIVTSDRIVELSGTFTIDKITDQNGQTVQNVTVQKTQYQTTNVTELKQLYEDLAYKRAQIEAREQALAGGGGFNLGSASPMMLVVLAGAAFLVLKD